MQCTDYLPLYFQFIKNKNKKFFGEDWKQEMNDISKFFFLCISFVQIYCYFSLMHLNCLTCLSILA